MYCFKCGAKVPDGAKFCSSCGAQLIDDPSAKEPTIPEEIRSEPSVAPDSKMTQVEEVSEDTKVQGTSEGLPKKKSTVKSIIELVLGAIILIAFLLSSTGVLNKQLVGEVGSYVMFFNEGDSYRICDDDGTDIIALSFGRGYNIEWTTFVFDYGFTYMRNDPCLASHILKCRNFVILIHFIRLNVFSI